MWPLYPFRGTLPICLLPSIVKQRLGCLELRRSQYPCMTSQVGMVMAKVRAAIDGDAPTALFFKAPTISGLARQIEALSAATVQAQPISSAPYSAEQLAQGIPCWPLQEHLLSQARQPPLHHRPTGVRALSHAVYGQCI